MKQAVAKGGDARGMMAQCGGSLAVTLPDAARPDASHDEKGKLRYGNAATVLDFQLRMNIAFKHCPDTLAHAFALVDSLRNGAASLDTANTAALDNINSVRSMRRMCLHLDNALDLLVQSRVAQARPIHVAITKVCL